MITADPDIIMYKKKDVTVYMNIKDKEQWMILGECNLCGSCIEGAVNPDKRPYKERLDIPTRPEIKDKDCSLRGVYL